MLGHQWGPIEVGQVRHAVLLTHLYAGTCELCVWTSMSQLRSVAREGKSYYVRAVSKARLNWANIRDLLVESIARYSVWENDGRLRGNVGLKP